MSDILDYLDWRGDIPFAVSPFNPVDGLILSQFCYIPLTGAVPDFGETVTLEEAFSRYDPDKVDDKAKIMTFRQDNELFEKMARSDRFRDMRLTGYTDIISSAEELQFSAVTFLPDDDYAFVSFSGTDGTVAGWKEDFSLSYMEKTAGQSLSVEYLRDHFSGNDRRIFIGGHSKGGNLAVYAAAFCGSSISSRIERIYSYDAPGFRDEIIASEEYQSILPRILSFVPESSVVGMLLNSDTERSIVKSSVSGIMQHMSYNWEVKRDSFDMTDEFTRSGTVVNKAITSWIDELSDDDRRTFTEAVFGVLEAPEKDTLKEILKGKWAAYSSMFRALHNMPPEQQTVLKEAVRKLAKSGKDAILPDKMPQIPDKINPAKLLPIKRFNKKS